MRLAFRHPAAIVRTIYLNFLGSKLLALFKVKNSPR